MRARRSILFGIVAWAAGCGGVPTPLPVVASNVLSTGGGAITLYRNGAVVAHRIAVTVPEAGFAHARLRIARDTDFADLVFLNAEELSLSELDIAPIGGETPAEKIDAPSELTLKIGARSAGAKTFYVAYSTIDLAFTAGYTLALDADRTHVAIDGALEVTNTTGVTLDDVEVRVVDGPLALRSSDAAAVTAALLGNPATPIEIARSVGRATLGRELVRMPLVHDAVPTELVAGLVYDPVTNRLDHREAAFTTDVGLGAFATQPIVHETLEFAMPPAHAGLPGGTSRVVERRADGTRALLQVGRSFEIDTRIGNRQRILLHAAPGLVGRRERREVSQPRPDRLVEEVAIELASTRSTDAEVTVVEHLYRGQNWQLAYDSSHRARQDGPQQISMRTHVPAGRSVTLYYVIVYSQPRQLP